MDKSADSPVVRRTTGLAVLLAIVGTALFVGLLVQAGLDEVVTELRTAGWGLLLVCAFHIVPLAADTASWMRLIDPPCRPSFARLLGMRWIGEAVNALLPAAQVGGDLVRARLAAIDRVPGHIAAASVLADLTLGILSQVVFTLLGLALLVWLLGGDAAEIAGPILLGLVAASLLFVAFYGAQRAGLFGALARLAARMARGGTGATLALRAENVDRSLDTLYRRRRDVAASFLWTLVAWIVGAGEVWLAFWVLGAPITLVEAVILESVAQAVRGTMFLVPGALGVQEVGILLVAGLLGIPAETAMAMALAKRARELLWGTPGLVVWPILEGRRAWPRRSGGPR